MLSAVNPPGPPCSPKVPAPNGDERAHPPERASSSLEADLASGLDEALLPQFSIRNYVFAARSKGIGTNWPFPRKYLQLCVEHGVRDLLPPFEPPDLVRARFSEKFAEADHLVVCSGVEGTQTEVDHVAVAGTDLLDRVSDAVKCDLRPPSPESVLGSTHQQQNPLSEDKSSVVQAVGPGNESIHGEVESKLIGHDHPGRIPSSVGEYPGSVQETGGGLESSSLEVAKISPLTGKIDTSCQPSVNKCRLIVNIGFSPESNRTEDTVSTFSSVSDPMASKVCPVCKTFSSTSNTTLNAHIDQCLSAESSAKMDVVKLSQHKVKPRKKRSMEEICATAPRCTLEDLDRRNGTNWASDLTSIAQNNDASCLTESKRPRISPVQVTDDEREGAVYIDSNGTKLLILSKFNDTPPTAAVGCPRPKKFRKEFGGRKNSPLGKKKSFSQKYKKYWKAKVQRKKMNSFNHLKGKIHKEDKFHADIHHEKEKTSQALNAQEQMKVGKPGTLGQWICSKRSSLFKPLNGKFRRRKLRNPSTTTQDTSVEGDQPASRDLHAIGHIQKISQSSDVILPHLKTRSTDVLSNAVLASGNHEKHSASLPDQKTRSMGNKSSTSNSIKLKLSRSTVNFVSSEKNKGVEIHANVKQKSGKFQHSTEKGSWRSLLVEGPKCPMETNKCMEVVQGMVSKKLRKRRFAEKVHKRVGNIPLKLVEQFHESHGAHDLGSASNNISSGMHQSHCSENNIAMPETSDTVWLSQSKTVDSNQANVDYHASEGGEYMNYSQLGADCRHAEVIEFDAQIEVPSNIESVIKCSSESANKVVMPENHEATTCDRLDPYVSLEYPGESSGANEATMLASFHKLLGDQGMPHGVINSSDAINQDIWQGGQMESSVKNDYCSALQNLEYQVDVASILGSSACLRRAGDKVLEVEKSTVVTSDRTGTAGGHNVIADGERPGSPVSAASTISHLSAEDLNSKDTKREPSEEHVVIQEESRSYSRNLGLLEYGSMGTEGTDLEITTQKVRTDAPAQETEEFRDGQPCCCSQRESISCTSKILRQSVMAGMVLPARMKQMTTSLYVKPVMPASGHSCSEAVAVPILDPPSECISARASSDFAVRVPTFNYCGSASSASHIQPQTASSPILRLMGKNLMVMKREENPEQQQHQAAAPCSSADTSNSRYVSLCGFCSTSSFSNQDDIQYHPPSLAGSMLSGLHPSNIQAPVHLPAERMDSFAGPLLQNGLRMKPDFHAPQKWSVKKPNALGLCNLEKACPPHERQKPIPVSRAPIPEREVIVIDDSPEHEAESSRSRLNVASALPPTFPGSDVWRVRPFSCYPSQNLNLLQPRERERGLKPGFPTSCPVTNADSPLWGGNSEPSDHLPPKPFLAPSPPAGQRLPPLHYSPTFR